MSSIKRPRPVLSCDPCRQRRLKCDKVHQAFEAGSTHVLKGNSRCIHLAAAVEHHECDASMEATLRVGVARRLKAKQYVQSQMNSHGSRLLMGLVMPSLVTRVSHGTLPTDFGRSYHLVSDQRQPTQDGYLDIEPGGTSRFLSGTFWGTSGTQIVSFKREITEIANIWGSADLLEIS